MTSVTSEYQHNPLVPASTRLQGSRPVSGSPRLCSPSMEAETVRQFPTRGDKILTLGQLQLQPNNSQFVIIKHTVLTLHVLKKVLTIYNSSTFYAEKTYLSIICKNILDKKLFLPIKFHYTGCPKKNAAMVLLP